MIKPISIKSVGQETILLTWEDVINDEVHRSVLAYDFFINSVFKEKILETVPTYQSIAVYLNLTEDIYELIEELKKSVIHASDNKGKRYKWFIPVCYENQFAPDLEKLAGRKKMSIQKLIQLHSNDAYKIYFSGFLPGFLYLGGLRKELHAPRKETPSLKIPKGSVAIGGKQTGIYPEESPGGWHIIGCTPIELFNANKKPPMDLSPNDYIQFYPIKSTDFNHLKRQIEIGNYKIKKEVLND